MRRSKVLFPCFVLLSETRRVQSETLRRFSNLATAVVKSSISSGARASTAKFYNQHHVIMKRCEYLAIDHT